MKQGPVIALIFFLAFSATAQSTFQAGSATIAFIENKGQIIDQDNKPNPAVLYLLNTPGMNVQLREGGFSYDLYSVIDTAQPTYKFHRIDFDLIGPNTNCNIVTSGISSDYLNFYTAGMPVQGITEVHSYKTVTYQNIYPGIDLQLFASGNAPFKYNFVVRPGGRISSVMIKISGAAIDLTSKGSLKLMTAIDTVEEVIPRSHYLLEGIEMPVEARFTESGNGVYGMTVDRDIPANATLIIDPLPDRVWGTYFGGAGMDIIGGCVASKNGNVFLYGMTNSPANIATAGAHQTMNMGSMDAFLAKFDKDGLIQWATYYGGTGMEQNISASLDQFQHVYLTGTTESETNIATPDGFQPVKDLIRDAFLARFNPDGVLQWGTYYGGEGADVGFECTVDLSGNVYLTGQTGSSDNIATPGAYQETLNGLYDVFLVKFDGSCHRLWATYYGGEDFDEGHCCAADSLGHIFVAGRTSSTTGIASPGSHQGVYGGNSDGFLACFTDHGQRIWGSYYGGEAYDDLIDCVSTLFGDVYITGRILSLINISTAGAFQPNYGGNDDGFVAKFKHDGTIRWGSYYGGTNSDWLLSCALDDSVNIYLAGAVTSSGLSTPGVYQPNLANSSQDCILVKFDSTGTRKWATYYGGLGADHGWCAVDTSWRVYISGQTASPTMLSSPGSYQPLFGGGTEDTFLARFTQCMIPAAAGSISGTDTVCKSALATGFSVAPISGASGYSWQLPPGAYITGSLNTNSIQVSFGASAISGNLTVHGINYCGSGETASLLVTVKDAPVPAVEGPDTICDGTQAVYSTSHGMFDYQWAISAGGTIVSGGGATDSTATVIWNTPGMNWIEAGYTDSSGCAAYAPAHRTVFVSDRVLVGVWINVSNDTVCAGQPVTCTAVPVNGGTSPQYQWKLNGINQLSGSPVFTYFPNNGDLITVIFTSSIVNCTLNNPATSTPVTMTVNLILPVGVTVNASSNPFCLGSTVTFTAPAINGGAMPSYQWIVNGINAINANNAVFSYTPLNGDVVACSLLS